MVDQGTFERLDVQILAISASNPFSQKTFADSLKLPYPLLSDYPDLTVIRQYDVMKRIGESHRPVARGGYFLIDKHGILRGRWLPPAGTIFSNKELLDMARDLEKKS